MKRFKSLMAVFVVFVFAASIFITPGTASANSAALSIAPKKNYVIESGDSVRDRLTIRNVDKEQDLQLTLRVIDFTYKDNSGTPSLMLAEDAPQTAWSLKPFMTVPTSVTIPAGQTKSLDMSIAIPSTHRAGSYYSAIVYSSGASDGGNVGLSASGVTLVFADIPGEVSEDMQLEKFGPYYSQRSKETTGFAPFFAFSKPDSMGYTLKNTGNVTQSPTGSITLKHMFGQEQTIGNVNPLQSLALIGQSRTFSACISLKDEESQFNGTTVQSVVCDEPFLWPGYYSTSINLLYGRNGNQQHEINGAGGFWYLPWWFVIAFFVILGTIAFFVWRIVNKIRNKKRGTRIKKMSRRK